MPYKKKFITAVFFTLLFYLGIVALITSVVAFFYAAPEFQKRSAELIVASLGFCMVSWLIAYMKRRSTLCPLCKSTPFLDNLARKHDKAYRIKPFNLWHHRSPQYGRYSAMAMHVLRNHF